MIHIWDAKGTIRVRVDQRVMAMNGYFTFLRSPKIEHLHQIKASAIYRLPRILCPANIFKKKLRDLFSIS